LHLTSSKLEVTKVGTLVRDLLAKEKNECYRLYTVVCTLFDTVRNICMIYRFHGKIVSFLLEVKLSLLLIVYQYGFSILKQNFGPLLKPRVISLQLEAATQ